GRARDAHDLGAAGARVERRHQRPRLRVARLDEADGARDGAAVALQHALGERGALAGEHRAGEPAGRQERFRRIARSARATSAAAKVHATPGAGSLLWRSLTGAVALAVGAAAGAPCDAEVEATGGEVAAG